MQLRCSFGGKKVPNSWDKALDLLKHNYASAMVIRYVPERLHHKVVIVTVHGVRQTLVSPLILIHICS